MIELFIAVFYYFFPQPLKKTQETKEMIDWKDPKAKISKYFSVHEATYLPSWAVHHYPSDSEKNNILKMAQVADKLRDYFGESMNIHCWTRPTYVDAIGSQYNGMDYNAHVGGAKNSSHILGLAIDYDVLGISCDLAREKLVMDHKLEELNIRMERREGSLWIHNDCMEISPGHSRYFFP